MKSSEIVVSDESIRGRSNMKRVPSEPYFCILIIQMCALSSFNNVRAEKSNLKFDLDDQSTYLQKEINKSNVSTLQC